MAWFDYLKAAETAFSFEAMCAVSLWHIFRHKIIMEHRHDKRKLDLVSERNQMEGSSE